jgi:hypothetical protein
MITLYRQLLARKRKKLDTSIQLELEGRTVNPPGYVAQMLDDIKALEQLIAKAEAKESDDAI